MIEINDNNSANSFRRVQHLFPIFILSTKKGEMKNPGVVYSMIMVLFVSSCAVLNGDPCKDFEPFTATNNGPFETGQTIELNASYLPSASYLWTGPNGFTSSEQNPVIYFSDFSDSGTYRVTATANDCNNIPPVFTRVIMTYPEIPCNPSPENKLMFTNAVNSEQYGTLYYSGRWNQSFLRLQL